jgi:hypothetical protein
MAIKIDQTISRAIDARLIAENQLRSKLREPSGKLSASILGDPVLWQVLHTLGYPSKSMDGYTLRKFARGNDVESWLVDFIPNLISKQLFLSYRDAIGFADAVVDSSGYDFKNGIVPVEIKSVTNANFKWVIKRNGPNDHHALQAAFYGLSMGSEHALITYVASDDYRTMSFVIDTADYKEKIDGIIDEYQEAMKAWEEKRVLPPFEPREDWQKNKKYSKFPEFDELDQQLIIKEVMEFFSKGVKK